MYPKYLVGRMIALNYTPPTVHNEWEVDLVRREQGEYRDTSNYTAHQCYTLRKLESGKDIEWTRYNTDYLKCNDIYSLISALAKKVKKDTKRTLPKPEKKRVLDFDNPIKAIFPLSPIEMQHLTSEVRKALVGK